MKLETNRLSADLFLVVTSIAIAFVVWLIAKEGELGQETLDAKISLRNVPPNVEAVLPFSTVRLLTSEPKSVGAQLRNDYFEVAVDWERLPNPHSWCGTRKMEDSPAFQLEPSMVVLGDVSEDLKQQIRRNVQFLEIQPSRVRVRARYVTRPARVVVKTRNAVADGYELDGPVGVVGADRDVLLTAAPETFARLGANEPNDAIEVQTREIDLANRHESATEAVPVILPDDVESATGEEPRVEVRIAVKEKTTNGYPVQGVAVTIAALQNKNLDPKFSPNEVDVYVKGSDKVAKALKPSDFVVRPTTAPDETPDKEQAVKLTASFADSVPAETRKAVEILRTNPASVQLRFQKRISVTLPDLSKSDAPNP